MRRYPVIASVFVALGLVPCANARAGTLDDHLRRTMPASEYALITSSIYKSFVRNSPISGYVKMLGSLNGDNVIIRDVVEVQPASADVKTARVLGGRAKFTSHSTGTRISPPVDVYVLYYNQDKPDRVALIFAVFGESAHHVQQSAANCFIDLVEYKVDAKDKAAAKPAPAVAAKSAKN